MFQSDCTILIHTSNEWEFLLPHILPEFVVSVPDLGRSPLLMLQDSFFLYIPFCFKNFL